MAFRGRVALVSGAASGMGRLAARTLADQGASVAALDINPEGLRETAQGREGIRPFEVDVTRPEAVDEAVARTEAELGPIDRVLNAAAIMPLGRLLEQDRATVHRVMDVNYGGVVNVARAALPRMLERGHGDFVNFASMAGWTPVLLMGAYNASKFAVVAFSEVLYHENRGRGVRITCVCPPPVDTPLLEQGRATAWPKLLDRMPPIEPRVVLESIERGLEKDEPFVFPGRGTRVGWWLRRLMPELVWRQVHRVEGW